MSTKPIEAELLKWKFLAVLLGLILFLVIWITIAPSNILTKLDWTKISQWQINPITMWGSTLQTSTALPQEVILKRLTPITVTILTDSSYFKKEKSIEGLISQIKNQSYLKDAVITILDYSQEKDKVKFQEILAESKSDLLPTIVLNTNMLDDKWLMSRSLVPVIGTSNFLLNVGASYKVPDIMRK